MCLTNEKLFMQNDKSDMERLHDLYIDMKHMDRMIDGGKLPNAATAGIWITNQGLEGTKARSRLSFAELVAILMLWGNSRKLSRLVPPMPLRMRRQAELKCCRGQRPRPDKPQALQARSRVDAPNNQCQWCGQRRAYFTRSYSAPGQPVGRVLRPMRQIV